MKAIKAVFAFVVLACALSAQASTTKDITSMLKSYKWYGILVQYEENGGNRHANYNLRYAVAQYLEAVDLYDAGNTPTCNDVDSNYHQKKRDSCYIGTAEQNAKLLKALKEKKVKEHLAKANAYLILNGPDDIFLNHIKGMGYDWSEKMAKDMASLPKKWSVWKKPESASSPVFKFYIFFMEFFQK